MDSGRRRDRIPQPGSPAARRRGFALVLVLLVLAIVAGLGLSLVGIAGGGDRASVAALAAARERAATRAGLARTLHLSRRDIAREGIPLGFAIDGMTVDVAVEPESSKVDLNVGDRGLLEAALRATGIDAVAEAAFAESLAAHRGDRRAMAGVAAGLRPCDRVGRLGPRLARTFTVMTRVRGVDLRLVDRSLLAALPQLQAGDAAVIAALAASGGSLFDDHRLAHLRGLLSDTSSAATIRVVVRPPGAAGGESRVAVFHELGRSVPRIAAVSETPAAAASLCGLID